jgi:RNA polymerase nonessential primary-like sigma factor
MELSPQDALNDGPNTLSLDSEGETLNTADASESKSQSFGERLKSIDSVKSKSPDATQLYLNEIGFSPLLSAEEEVKYSRMAIAGIEAGRKRMIESNLRLVVKISRRYLNRGLSLLDLIE